MKKRANLFDARTHLELTLPEPRQAEAKPPHTRLEKHSCRLDPRNGHIDSKVENTERRIFSTLNF